ncbi:hypothetical protein HH310_03705 [Actinoplanes sp. TBRC 11911]|uniref:hypothetical protein n=1 Tax=Actinoplanes sp. TBRC 11911 TaxID=2729386 RepID=UPI00145E6B34|nr:hypothetical protein [Actinoplanes sp. TBRC 11911]NMO50298.1 hypothetical protein [Actinoplanes sp. TBRC 11911]
MSPLLVVVVLPPLLLIPELAPELPPLPLVAEPLPVPPVAEPPPVPPVAEPLPVPPEPELAPEPLPLLLVPELPPLPLVPEPLPEPLPLPLVPEPPPVPPVPPVPLAGGAGGTGFGTGAELSPPPSPGVVGSVVGGVLVDSVGRVVLGFGDGVFDGLLLALGAGREVILVDSSRGASARGTGGFVPRRGRPSVTSSALVWLVGVGVGTGVGSGCGGCFGSFGGSARPGSGSTALERTGPPARLTLIRPPYIITRTPNAYASRRSNRLRRPVLSTKTGAGAETEITSVSGMSASMNCGLLCCCAFTRRA